MPGPGNYTLRLNVDTGDAARDVRRITRRLSKLGQQADVTSAGLAAVGSSAASSTATISALGGAATAYAAQAIKASKASVAAAGSVGSLGAAATSSAASVATLGDALGGYSAGAKVASAASASQGQAVAKTAQSYNAASDSARSHAKATQSVNTAASQSRMTFEATSSALVGMNERFRATGPIITSTASAFRATGPLITDLTSNAATSGQVITNLGSTFKATGPLITDLTRNAAVSGRVITNLGSAFQATGPIIRSVGGTFQGLQHPLNGVATAAQTAAPAVTGLGEAARATKPPITNVGTALDDTAMSSGGLFQSFKRLAGSFARQLANIAAITAAFLAMRAAIGLVTLAIGTFSAFQAQMAGVESVTRSTEAQMVEMTETARFLGRTTRFSALEASEGMEILGRAGFEVREVIQTIPAVLNLSAAAKLSVAEAATLTSTTLRSFGLETQKASEVADVLSATSANTNTNVHQLGEGLKFVSNVARDLDIPLSETSAALGVLADAGVNASLAGTGLRRFLADLVNPTEKARGVIQKLGLDVEDITPTTNEFLDILQRFRDADLGTTEAFQIFDLRGAPTILALIELLPRLREVSDTIKNSVGEAARQAAIRLDTLEGAFFELQSAANDLRIAFGESIEPVLIRAADKIRDFFRESGGSIEEFGLSISGVILALGDIFIGLVKNLDLLGVAFDTLKLVLVGLAAAFVAWGLIAVAHVAFYVSLASVVTGLTTAMTGLWAAMVAHPLVALAVALTAVGLAFFTIQRNARRARIEHARLQDDLRSARVDRDEFNPRAQATIDTAVENALPRPPTGLPRFDSDGNPDGVDLATRFPRFIDRTNSPEVIAFDEAIQEQNKNIEAAVKERDRRLDEYEAALKRQRQLQLLQGDPYAPIPLQTETDRARGSLESANSKVEENRRRLGIVQDALDRADFDAAVNLAFRAETDRQDAIADALAAAELEAERLRQLEMQYQSLTVGIARQTEEANRLTQARLVSVEAGIAEEALIARENEARQLIAEGLSEYIEQLEVLKAERAELIKLGAQESEGFAALSAKIAAAEGNVEGYTAKLEALIANLQESQRESVGAGILTGIRQQTKDLNEQLDVYRRGGPDAAAAAEELGESQAFAAETARLVARAAPGQEAAIRQARAEFKEASDAVAEFAGVQEDAGDAVEGTLTPLDNYLQRLRENVDITKNQLAATEEGTRLQRLFGVTTKEAAIEAEVQNRIRESGIDLQIEQNIHDAQALEILFRKRAEIRALTEEEIEAFEATRRFEEKTQDLVGVFRELGDAIGSLSPRFGEAVSGIGDLVEGFRGLVALDEDASRAQRFQQGARFGGQIASVGVGLGAFQGQRGQGSLGGELSGDYSEVGGALGGGIGAAAGSVGGPVTAAIGALIGGVAGTIIGGLISSGADEGLSRIRQTGDETYQQITRNQGGLGDILDRLGQGIIDTISNLEDRIGDEIRVAGADFKIRDDVVTVFVNGLRRSFKDIEEATTFALSELLRTASFGEGVGEATRTVLTSGRIDSIDEIDEILELALAIDRLGDDTSSHTEAIRSNAELTRRQIGLAKEYGLELSDVLRLEAQRLSQIRDSIEAQRRSLIGGQDFASPVEDFLFGVEEFNAELVRRAEDHANNIAATQTEIANLQARIAAGDAGGAPSGPGGIPQNDAPGGGFGDLPDGSLDTLGDTGHGVATSLEDLNAQLLVLQDRLIELQDTELPDAIDPAKIAEVFEAVGNQAVSGIIELLQRVHGQQFMSGEQQQLQAQLFTLQLISSQQALLALIEASDGLFSVSQSFLDSIQGTIDGLIDGSLTLENTLLGSYQRIIDEFGKHEIVVAFREILDRYTEAIAGVGPLEGTPEEIAAGEVALGDINQGAGFEVLNFIEDQLNSLVQSGDVEGLRRLRRQFLRLPEPIQKILKEMGLWEDALEDLDEGIAAAQRQLKREAIDFIGSLEELNIALSPSQTEDLARAMFEVNRLEALATALRLKEAGALKDLNLTYAQLVDLINGAEYEAPNPNRGRRQQERENLERTIERAFESLRNFLEDLRDERNVGSEVAFTEAQREFRSLAVRAASGEVQALEDLTDAGQRYLEASESFLGASNRFIVKELDDTISGILPENADRSNEFYQLEELRLANTQLRIIAESSAYLDAVGKSNRRLATIQDYSKTITNRSATMLRNARGQLTAQRNMVRHLRAIRESVSRGGDGTKRTNLQPVVSEMQAQGMKEEARNAENRRYRASLAQAESEQREAVVVELAQVRRAVRKLGEDLARAQPKAG